MRERKDSLLKKIVTYNDLTIFLTTIIILLTSTITLFNSIEEKFKETTQEKMIRILSNYNIYHERMRNQVYFEILKSQKIEENEERLEKIKETLQKQDKRKYKNIILSLVGNEHIGEADYEQDRLIEEKGKLYVEMLFSYSEGIDGKKMRLLYPFKLNLLDLLTKDLGITSIDRIIFLPSEEIEDEILKEDIKESILKGKRWFFRDVRRSRTGYYIGVFPLQDENNKNIGSFILRVSKKQLLEEKTTITIIMGIVAVFTMIISSSVLGSVFRETLKPLKELTNASEKISNGENLEEIEIEENTEILEFKRLIISLKKMIQSLGFAQKRLTLKNEKLEKNFKHINSINKFLVSLNIEENTDKIIDRLMNILISEGGFNHSRAIYFRYNRETDDLIGEKAFINKKLKTKNVDKFEFQVEELDKVIHLIKVPINKTNLLSKSFKNKIIVFKNDSGYKYDLGNDLLNSLGIKNFYILPIYDAGSLSGVVLIDNYNSPVEIEAEELKLLNILAINISVEINEKEKRKEFLENDRIETIKKVTEKFLEISNESSDTICQKSLLENPNVTLAHENCVKENIKKIQENNFDIKKYSEYHESPKEKFLLEELFTEIIKENKQRAKKENVMLSFFNTIEGKIYADRGLIKKSIIGLLGNSFEALEDKRDDKKINITLSKKKSLGKIIIKIVDNGSGISEELMEKIYEPFTTTKKHRLGLGLFYIKKVIEDHKGVIKHTSTNDKQTEVKITLNEYKEEN